MGFHLYSGCTQRVARGLPGSHLDCSAQQNRLGFVQSAPDWFRLLRFALVRLAESHLLLLQYHWSPRGYYCATLLDLLFNKKFSIIVTYLFPVFLNLCLQNIERPHGG